MVELELIGGIALAVVVLAVAAYFLLAPSSKGKVKVAAQTKKAKASKAKKQAEPVVEGLSKKAKARAKKALEAKATEAKPEAKKEQKAKPAAPKAEPAQPKSPQAAGKAAPAPQEGKQGKKQAQQPQQPQGKKGKKGQQQPAAAPAPVEVPKEEQFQVQKTRKSKQQRNALTNASAIKTEAVVTTPGEPDITGTVEVPPKNVALIIGAGGATLKMIQEATKTKIDTPKRDSGSSTVTITGPAAGVELAKKTINQLVTKGFSSITHAGSMSAEMTVDQKMQGRIVGSGGESIRAIEKATGVKLKLPERGADSDKVTIVGTKENIKAAKAIIKELVQYGFSSATHPGWAKIDVPFPTEHINFLVGPKGQTIRSIQGDTNTKIDTRTGGAFVTVVGPADKIEKARRQILKQLENATAKDEVVEDPEFGHDADLEADLW